jgi:hypothetical protein
MDPTERTAVRRTLPARAAVSRRRPPAPTTAPGRLRWIGLLALLGAILAWTVYRALQPGPWQRVYATREGLVGRRLATGDIQRAGDRFVALPHRSALRRTVEVRYRERIVVAPVRDVGPWNVDDPYWDHGRRPAAELGRGTFRRPSNPAGIDLSDATFAALGMKDNGYVEWRFVHRGYIPLPRLSTR